MGNYGRDIELLTWTARWTCDRQVTGLPASLGHCYFVIPPYPIPDFLTGAMYICTLQIGLSQQFGISLGSAELQLWLCYYVY